MRILVTGSSGFLGRHVLEALKGYGEITTWHGDLTKSIPVFSVDCVVHLAAKCGGIGANQKRPAEFIYDNLMMGLNVIEGCRRGGTKKLVLIGTVCSYPEVTPTPFSEESLWNGYPEPTNAPYGIAKRTLFEVAKAYRAQYGLNSICLLPANLYGPGDNFDLETSHVIPAIIRKCIEARDRGDKKITLWGSGNATREFLYVKDCAKAIRTVVLKDGDFPGPYNIGVCEQISINHLSEMIKLLTGFKGEIEWDNKNPDGQRVRFLSVKKAWKEMGIDCDTPLEDGLEETIKWYEENKCGGH